MTTLTEATRIQCWILKHYQDKPWLTYVGIEAHPEDGHRIWVGIDRALISDEDLIANVMMCGVPVFFRHQESKGDMSNPPVAVGDYVRFENTVYGCWAVGPVLSITDKLCYIEIVLDVREASGPETWRCDSCSGNHTNEDRCGIPAIGKPHTFGWCVASAHIHTFRIVDRPHLSESSKANPVYRRDGFAQSDIDAAKAVLLMQVRKR